MPMRKAGAETVRTGEPAWAGHGKRAASAIRKRVGILARSFDCGSGEVVEKEISRLASAQDNGALLGTLFFIPQADANSLPLKSGNPA
jgi:hypothetical protein